MASARISCLQLSRGLTWLTYVLLPPNYQTELLDRVDANVLLSARLIDHTPPIKDVSTQPVTDALFNRMSKDGPSLCKQWMPHDGLCDRVEIHFARFRLFRLFKAAPLTR
jgi:hypothetical protein